MKRIFEILLARRVGGVRATRRCFIPAFVVLSPREKFIQTSAMNNGKSSWLAHNSSWHLVLLLLRLWKSGATHRRCRPPQCSNNEISQQYTALWIARNNYHHSKPIIDDTNVAAAVASRLRLELSSEPARSSRNTSANAARTQANETTPRSNPYRTQLTNAHTQNGSATTACAQQKPNMRCRAPGWPRPCTHPAATPNADVSASNTSGAAPLGQPNMTHLEELKKKN
eukprot:CAMPEP_0204360648 /NCGR_PEP_ID=MMETSP0469-20131031/38199_1 /ASSEMBLY_ACC=CAM_ASM_000384 /TAXON_ID=2969 /ORGANISM="Oxyrrhis marina" /LENGTH=226 /DNA_ID=CAMNT_0051348909 /DNA_START=51 /DNA_END=729 /DNA_ORIENTATION=-